MKMKKIRINNTLIVDYSEEKIEELNNSNTHYEIGYTCSDCGKFLIEDTDIITFVTNNHGNEYPVCDDCINSEIYYYCDVCNTWYDDTVQDYITEDERRICDYCRENYVECSVCGNLIHENYIHYCDDCERNYCPACWEDHYHEDDNENLLYDYHAFRDWRPFQLDNEQPPFYIGHELEIDDGNLCDEVVNTITSKIPAVCMHDGSLHCDGLEIVSQPMSYNYYLSKEQDYRELFSDLTSNYGYKSHNTSTCGLHFHVTRPQNDEIIDRIILFMETYKEEIITLSRRNGSEISSWCNFLSDYKTDVNEKTIKSIDYIKKNKYTSSRYMALNLCNSNTIEFRIFKGTLKYETFMADLEFVNNLVTLASDLTIPVEELTWTQVTSTGHFLPSYVEEYNLHTDKPIIDYTTEILIERNRELANTKKELRILYKKLVSEINKLTTEQSKRFNIHNMVDIGNLSTYTSFLECVIRDIKYINTINYMHYIEGIKNRIRNIKGRMI